MLTIQLKVERETANPIKAMKRIDLGLRIDTSARRLLSPEEGRGRPRGQTFCARLVKKQLLLGQMSLT